MRLLPTGTQDRLFDTDTRRQEFYDGLCGSVLAEELAEQIRQLEE